MPVSILFVAGCGGGPSGLAAERGQSRMQMQQVIDRLEPTTRVAPLVHQDQLWRAAKSYMEDMYEIAPPPPNAKPRREGERAIETESMEWYESSIGHRTRIVARVGPDGPANTKLSVSALLIEGTPSFVAAADGVPLAYEWRHQGSNPKIEEAVCNGIYQRYLAFVEGKPAPPLEFEPVKPRSNASGSTPAPAPSTPVTPKSGRG